MAGAIPATNPGSAADIQIRAVNQDVTGLTGVGILGQNGGNIQQGLVTQENIKTALTSAAAGVGANIDYQA
ncbi:MAG: hypothetical protein JKX97_05165 [Candidatus Lindowbacteria bacterium]|nr:hypothetical protein [Candidatus Lindowbacteria bacterium]